MFGCSNTANTIDNNEPLKFCDVTASKEDIKSLVYGSNGWIFYHSYQSPYVYAQTGSYIIRYNMADNNIDRIAELAKLTDDYTDRGMSFSSDGNYVVIYNSWINHSEYVPSDIYLVDFDNSEVAFLSSTHDALTKKTFLKN